ncbi:hypothetical protein MATL_G00043430 [Megalops atlanticus]|uniref:Fibronectin type-III domain-containing protein n=1 Tax=Megalops atlanticus TaxID=7932 RepID=A0A9D3QA42_MEGAT|nr:hypothetical protein MATL_G00043430 [Megalops atlanticus]
MESKMKPIEIAALGRPLYPGMLYNCCNDSFIPGITLWDREALSKDLDVRIKPNTSFSITASDSLRDKSKLMDMSVSLKASFLGGLLSVGGSGHFLNNRATSHCQSRVIMQYRRTVRYEGLTMTQLGLVPYPQVFNQKSATHVVTAVLYGAHAFFVFDGKASTNKHDVEGKMQVMLQSIPQLSMEGGAELKLSSNQKEVVESFSCTFHGDFELKRNPTNFREAVEVYRTLPEMLGKNGEKAVPVRVWLLPLQCLDSHAARLVREVSESLVYRAESVLETLVHATQMCSDLQSRAQNLPHCSEVSDKLRDFCDNLQHYSAWLQKSLARILPLVRQGLQDEEVLDAVLQSHGRSPFAASKLKKWLNDKESELAVLGLYSRRLKEFPSLSPVTQLGEVLFNPDVDAVICFTFTSLHYTELYLSTLSSHLDSVQHGRSVLGQDNADSIGEDDIKPWFRSAQLSVTMRNNLNTFVAFAEANKDKKETRFVVSAISDPSHPGASIRLYQRGLCVDPQFQPVSKPCPPVSTDVQCTHVTLTLQPAHSEQARHYRVEHRRKQRGDGTGPGEGKDGGWTVTDTPGMVESWTLKELQPGVSYLIRYRAVSDVGESKPSDVTEICTQTSSVLRTRAEALKYTQQLSWDPPTRHMQGCLCHPRRNVRLSKGNHHLPTQTVLSLPICGGCD